MVTHVPHRKVNLCETNGIWLGVCEICMIIRWSASGRQQGKAACDLRYLGTDQCHVFTEPGNTTNNDDCRSLVISTDVCHRCYKRPEWAVRLPSGSFYRRDRVVSTDLSRSRRSLAEGRTEISNADSCPVLSRLPHRATTDVFCLASSLGVLMSRLA